LTSRSGAEPASSNSLKPGRGGKLAEDAVGELKLFLYRLSLQLLAVEVLEEGDQVAAGEIGSGFAD